MKRKLLCLIVGTFSVLGAFAQTYKNEIGLQADNDSFLGQGSDRYYTNGIFFFYRTALSVKDTGKIKNKILGFEGGQKLYNAFNGRIPNPTLIDRPIAGYLYAGVNLNLLYANESNLKLTAQIGVLGPGALGDETQTSIHEWFGFYQPLGWQYQIHDGAQLNLSADYNKLLFRKGLVDLTLATHAALGNGFSGLGVGPLVRFGNFNHLYNSVSTQSTISRSSTGDLHPHEFFAYYKPMLNYVAYNATIQGSLFNKTVYPDQVVLTPNRFVLDNQIGVAYTANHWVFDASVIFQTPEVQNMRRSEQWGSVSISYRF